MLTTYVKRMFPISFARQSVYGARSLSESNLVSWIQNLAPDSSTKHSFMITETVNKDFGKDLENAEQTLEFIIGGYYVKLSDRFFIQAVNASSTTGTFVTPYYAYIKLKTHGADECFTTLDGGELDSGNGNTDFTALKISTDITKLKSNEYDYVLHLFDLKQTNVVDGETINRQVEYLIPRTSLRTIDGGEI